MAKRLISLAPMLLLLLATRVSGQTAFPPPADSLRPRVRARPVTGIRVDGLLDEAD